MTSNFLNSTLVNKRALRGRGIKTTPVIGLGYRLDKFSSEFLDSALYINSIYTASIISADY